MKNVLKSFWRKPREEGSALGRGTATGIVRYRFDRIESQILLLADTCFLIKVCSKDSVSKMPCMFVIMWFDVMLFRLILFRMVRENY